MFSRVFKSLVVLVLFLTILSNLRCFKKKTFRHLMTGYLFASEIARRPPKYQVGEPRQRGPRVPKMATAVKLSRFVHLMQYGLLAGCIILSGDVSPNPGPFDLRNSTQGGGITIGHWNVQHLTGMQSSNSSLHR